VTRAFVYGAVNPDLVHLVDAIPGPGDDVRSRSWRLTWGGKAANAAVALAGWGVDTILTGLVIGLDPLGDALVAALARPHLDLSLLERRSGEPTRHCVILVTPDGDRTIVCAGYHDATWSRPTLPDVEVVLLDGFGAAAAVEVAARAGERGIPVVWLDAPTPEVGRADVVVWSAHEHDEEEAAAASSATAVILTRGPGPVTAWRSGAVVLTVRPPPIEVADTTGAGDVFAAACARGLALGHDLETVVYTAVSAAPAARGRPRGET
jgi:ribokinase